MSKGETGCSTLCGTCRWWDHEYAVRHETERAASIASANAERKRKGLILYQHSPWRRVAKCKWGEDMAMPWWLPGLRGDRFTNEAGVTKDGCAAWEKTDA
jgi:hypothetical protein